MNGLKNLKRNNMKTVLQILSAVSLLVSVYEMYKGRTDGVILFLVWAFYLKYLSDQKK